jgi:hypothetical protein
MKKYIPILLILTTTMLVGCRSNRVVFVTESSLGLDVSGTAEIPNKVSLSYKRFEGAIVPRKNGGEAHSVYGGLDADIHFFKGHTIKQTFATGKAAMLATDADMAGVNFTNSAVTNINSLVFLTSTTYGLHLEAGQQSTPPNMLMGYRRSEMAVIPTPDPGQEVRSVYADIEINTASTNGRSISTNFSQLRGVRMRQSFATGRAAEKTTGTNPAVREKLTEAAGAMSLTDFQKKAAVERQITTDVRALSATQQQRLFLWADKTFPVKSRGRLAGGSTGLFLDDFLPELTLEERQAVVGKINEIKQETR